MSLVSPESGSPLRGGAVLVVMLKCAGCCSCVAHRTPGDGSVSRGCARPGAAGVLAAAATLGVRSATSQFRRSQAKPSSPTASVPMPPAASDATGFAADAIAPAKIAPIGVEPAKTVAVSYTHLRAH